MTLANLKFIQVSPKELEAFWRGRDKEGLQLVVYMLILNTARVLKQSEFKFAPRWHQGFGMDRRCVLRAMRSLAEQGVIEILEQDGRHVSTIRVKEIG